MTKKKIIRPDLQIPVDAWGTIKSATAKLTWLQRVDACIAARVVPRSFAHLAIKIATKWINEQTGLAWRGAKGLGEDIGMSEPSMIRLLDTAEAAGLLFAVKRGKPGRGNTTIYRLAMPEAGNTKTSGGFYEGQNTKTGEGFDAQQPGRKTSIRGAVKPPSVSKKTSTGGYEPLRDSISVENNLRVAAEGGATTARGDSSNTVRAVRESADGSSAVSEPLASAPSAPHGAWKEPDIASQLTPPPSATVFPLHRDNPRASIGWPPDGAHAANADADAERTAVIDHGRKVLGAGCETLVARLHDAERAVDPDGAAERVHDGLDAASNEEDPIAHIENAIEIAESLGC
ncbi:hypothetical protein [Bradyrhizobium sp. S3.9.1]|uniref:hypothetical protein n=1 Tax=Bradyrhizobium sp. S3.9.1 TaxID=3156431 RepID=UPI0033950B7D